MESSWPVWLSFLKTTMSQNTEKPKLPRPPVDYSKLDLREGDKSESQIRFEQLREKRPSWLKVPAPSGERYENLHKLIREKNLHTVCESAHCPNLGDL